MWPEPYRFLSPGVAGGRSPLGAQNFAMFLFAYLYHKSVLPVLPGVWLNNIWLYYTPA